MLACSAPWCTACGIDAGAGTRQALMVCCALTVPLERSQAVILP